MVNDDQARVQVVAGRDDKRLELAGHIEEIVADCLFVRLDIRPFRPEALQPGVLVRLIRETGREQHVEILPSQGEPDPRLLRVRVAEPPTQDEANRRTYFRVSMRRAETQLTVLAGNRAARLHIRLIDMSGSGVRFTCPQPLEVGFVLVITLPLIGGSQPRDLRAHVQWVRPAGKEWQIGAEFFNVPAADRDLIVRTVFMEEVRSRLDSIRSGDEES